jgi:hypothetical protein
MMCVGHLLSLIFLLRLIDEPYLEILDLAQNDFHNKGAKTLNLTTLNITAFSIMTLSIKDLTRLSIHDSQYVRQSLTTLYHSADCHYAECPD